MHLSRDIACHEIYSRVPASIYWSLVVGSCAENLQGELQLEKITTD